MTADIHCPDCRVQNGSKVALNWDHEECVRRFEAADEEFAQENPCLNYGRDPLICLNLAEFFWYKAIGEAP